MQAQLSLDFFPFLRAPCDLFYRQDSLCHHKPDVIIIKCHPVDIIRLFVVCRPRVLCKNLKKRSPQMFRNLCLQFLRKYYRYLKLSEFFRKTVFCLRMGIHVRQIRFDIKKRCVIKQIQPGNRKNRSKLCLLYTSPSPRDA